jgi:hypothetical protein
MPEEADVCVAAACVVVVEARLAAFALVVVVRLDWTDWTAIVEVTGGILESASEEKACDETEGDEVDEADWDVDYITTLALFLKLRGGDVGFRTQRSSPLWWNHFTRT